MQFSILRLTINIPTSRTDVLGIGWSRKFNSRFWFDIYFKPQLGAFLRLPRSRRWFRLLPYPVLMKAEGEDWNYRRGRGYRRFCEDCGEIHGKTITCEEVAEVRHAERKAGWDPNP